MSDLNFDVQLSWSGAGRTGEGAIETDDLTLELSTPESMGGRGVGTNPEELLVSAVASCYSATLFRLLERAELPVQRLSVAARGTVEGFPMRSRFAALQVSPTIVGGDEDRRDEYEQAARTARERCFIGGTLRPEVNYEVGAVELSGRVVEEVA